MDFRLPDCFVTENMPDIVNKSTFIKFPKFLLEPRYTEISTDAKVLYSFMLDREQLSKLNSWVDETMRVYIYFTVEQTAKLLGASKPTASKAIKELVEANLIEIKRQGLGKPSKIYVNKPFGYVDNS